ncbi:hypothetical protein DER44DRAFT_841717 [Fusarium oxysporum]|nr:hypothetical protein DER44DRAFT_841717 [Fusarium oxysporum]
MREVFCCSKIEPYRPRQLDHESKFTAFMTWANSVSTSLASKDTQTPFNNAPYAVQIVRQVNFGPRDSIRYFIPASEGSVFAEATEDDLLEANFEKLNSAINTHHWRATLSRPSRDIGLSFRQKRCEPLPSTSHRETLTLPARHEVAERENEDRLSDCNEGSSSQLDVITLKNYLRFLLPSIGTSLGSGRILSLLTLDWINKELALGLDFEARWDTELNVSNISAFLCDWLEMSAGEIVFASKIEGLVIPAIRYVELLGGHQIPGRDRLQGIVDHILNRNPSVDWVSKYGAHVAHVHASPPKEELLEQCRHRNKNIGFYSSDSGSMKDFTACDKACGYCGHCDY